MLHIFETHCEKVKNATRDVRNSTGGRARFPVLAVPFCFEFRIGSVQNFFEKSISYEKITRNHSRPRDPQTCRFPQAKNKY